MQARTPRRLDPCPCGSGRRYKDCHGRLVDGREAQAQALDARALQEHAALRLDEAERLFRAALEAAPASPRIHAHLGMLLLLQGRYEEGWKEYAWRAQIPGPANFAAHDFGMPRWRGEPLAGKRVLLHAEQGLGDTMQFARFIRPLAREGAQVDLFCHAPLASLLARVEGVHAAMSELLERPTHDFHAPLGDLVARYVPSPDAAHWTGSYLSPLPERLAAWREHLAGIEAPRVGLVLRGNPLHVDDRRRSVPTALWTRFAARRGTFVNLQVDTPLPTALALPAPIADWDDTAAIVAALDAVLCVDTSVAHLAGAMGKPVLVMLAYCPDWRWGLAGERTPWYPSMRLLRQPRPGDWAPVIEAALEAAAAP